jgi:hypothetical protein
MQCTGKTTVAKGIIDKFQSPDGEIGNAVLSLGFRMEYRMRWAFFQT